jgi:hypothetical protein
MSVVVLDAYYRQFRAGWRLVVTPGLQSALNFFARKDRETDLGWTTVGPGDIDSDDCCHKQFTSTSIGDPTLYVIFAHLRCS